MTETTLKVIERANMIALIVSCLLAVMLTLSAIWLFQVVKKRFSNRLLLFGIGFFGLFSVYVLTIFVSFYIFDRIYKPYVLKLIESSSGTTYFISPEYGIVPLWDAGPGPEVKLVNGVIIFLVCSIWFLKNWNARRIEKNANA